MNGNNHFATETNFNFDTSKGWSNATSTKGAKVTLVTGATLKSLGTEQSVRWKVIGRYYNLDLNQYALSGKSFTGKIYVENVNCSSEDGTTVKKGYETILANNGGKTAIEAKGIPDFTASATENEGMYKATDDLGTSYYFRGAVDNNWVKYGKYTKDMYNCNNGTISNTDTGNLCTKIASKGDDIYWRIIRINGDGSIRMIYTGTTSPTASTKVVMTGEGTQIGTSAFNSSYDKAEYVGYQYIEGQQQGYVECNGTSASCTVNGNTVYNSTIKQAIDKWYVGTTLETDAATKSLVSQDQIFCNDRSASSTQTEAWTSCDTDYEHGAYGRLISNKKPILTCPTASDKFTVNTSNGNGALTYPVGLITADEVAMAGGVSNKVNSSYYLYTNQNYWFGSPSNYDLLMFEADEIFADSSGYLFNGNVNYTYGARPVVSLSSAAKLLGSGTYNDVYTVN